MPPNTIAPRLGNVVIGLVNNMPDAAMEATELQFSNLLHKAAGTISVRLRFTSLPELARGAAATVHLRRNYWPLQEFMHNPPDAIIVTGAEPVAPQLSWEPYWLTFVHLVDWAREHTVSSIWSCLAAHAAVQHISGIVRQRLPRKCCGVFEHQLLTEKPLLRGIAEPLTTPHSRWNELAVTALRDSDYSVLSHGPITGADIFARPAPDHLMVFFQGHPEYETTTLLKEYRRDVGRFLRGQQPHYPTLPHGYFSAEAADLLDAFQLRCLKRQTVDNMSEFPLATVEAGLRNTWAAGAQQIYANWLLSVASGRTAT